MNTGLWILLAAFCTVSAAVIVGAYWKEYSDNAEYWQISQDYDKEEGLY